MRYRHRGTNAVLYRMCPGSGLGLGPSGRVLAQCAQPSAFEPQHHRLTQTHFNDYVSTLMTYKNPQVHFTLNMSEYKEKRGGLVRPLSCSRGLPNQAWQPELSVQRPRGGRKSQLLNVLQLPLLCCGTRIHRHTINKCTV